MKSNYIFTLCLALTVLGSCSNEKMGDRTNQKIIEQQLQKLSEELTALEKNDDLKGLLANYDEKIISMPEYQLTLQGVSDIETFYKEIFHRQNIKSFQRKAEEFIHLDSTVIEIGTFRKEFTNAKNDSLSIQKGKYWNVWGVRTDGQFKIKGEAFGFFHPIKHPEELIITRLNKKQPDESEIVLKKQILFELKAYNALMEKGVRNRDGILRSEFFTGDGSFMLFADSTVTGMDKIKPYLIAYNNGNVIIDSITCYTYDFEDFGDHVLEYDMFKVKWSVPNFSGRTEGKGIRIWRRQKDKSLRIYREIGTHNHLD